MRPVRPMPLARTVRQARKVCRVSLARRWGGSQGNPGLPGGEGDIGPSNAYAKTESTPTVYGPGITSPAPVLTLSSLPAGSYVVNAKAWAVGKSTNAYVR